MADVKTVPTEENVEEFLHKVENEERRQDSFELLKLMQKITKKEATMWGPSIVGFGTYHYKYASGREGDCPIVGFSPRKQNLTLYLMTGFDKHQKLMEQLGPHKTGSSCLYLKRLSDVDQAVLAKLIDAAFQQI